MAEEYEEPPRDITGEDLVEEIQLLINHYRTEYPRVHRFERAQRDYERLAPTFNPENPLSVLSIRKVLGDLKMFERGIIGLRDTYEMAFFAQYLHAKYKKEQLPSDLSDELDNMNAEVTRFTQGVLGSVSDKVSHLTELLYTRDLSYHP